MHVKLDSQLARTGRRRSLAVVAAMAVAGSVLLAPAAAHAAPAVVDDAYSLPAESSFSSPDGQGLLANDHEVAGVPGAGVLIQTQPTNGVLSGVTSAGAFTYLPNAAFGGVDSFTYCFAFGGVCVTGSATVTLTVQSQVERIGAADRFAESAAVSASRFARGVPAVFVASGSVFPDALSAGAAAGVSGGPVLLVTRDAIPDVVRAELTRLAPQKIYLLGGANTVGDAVEADLRGLAPEVSRISGADRFAVSAAVSAKVFVSPPAGQVVYVASGEVFPDALSASAIGGVTNGPVLLVQRDSVPAAVAAEITRLAPARIVVLGGANTVSEAVVARLRSMTATVTRIGGADRYAVSAGVAAAEFNPPQTHVVYIASGEIFPDALSGSPAAISRHAPVLLVSKNSVPASVGAELTRLHPNRIVVLGGVNSISAQVENDLKAYLAH